MEGNNNQRCDVCGSGNGQCGRCGNMCGFGGNNILRWILGIIIVTWIFSAGMKFGEMKASIERVDFDGPQNIMFRAMPLSATAGAAGFSSASPANFTVSTMGVPSGRLEAGTVKVISN